MYETRDQKRPVYDAKGIETVRRDGVPATVKILEKSIKTLFDTKDLSQVKSYVQVIVIIINIFLTLWQILWSRPSSARSWPAPPRSATSPSPRSSAALAATGPAPRFPRWS